MLKLGLGLLTLFAAAVAVVGGIVFASDEDNASALHESAGFTASGTKFGIRVGDHINSAEQALRPHHFVPYRQDAIQTCLTHEYPKSEAVVVYADDSWRKGTICIAYDRQSGTVRAIEWAYGPFMVEL
jgi:hypothetical protein